MDAPKGKPVVRLSNHTATMTVLPAAIVSSAREDLGEYSSTAADDSSRAARDRERERLGRRDVRVQGDHPEVDHRGPSGDGGQLRRDVGLRTPRRRFDHRLTSDAEHQREISRRRVILGKSAVGWAVRSRSRRAYEMSVAGAVSSAGPGSRLRS